MSTQAQVDANRLNSQQSTGPKTDAGKVISSHNAVKSALTGRTILLPNDDVPGYQKLSQTFVDQHCPANYEEQIIVQSLIDAEWRLLRIPGLEAALYAIGRIELANQVPADQLEVQIFIKYQRDLKNLSLQESRLRRMREKDLAHLKQIQAERKEKEEVEKEKTAAAKATPEKTVPASAAALFNEAKQAAAANPSLDISGIGFEFSKPKAA